MEIDRVSLFLTRISQSKISSTEANKGYFTTAPSVQSGLAPKIQVPFF